MNKHTHFKIAALAAAVALAMGSTAAMAATTAPTSMQLPGQGEQVSGTAATIGLAASGVQTIAQSGSTVINWGVSSGATINTGATAQPGGFNIGSGANLSFTGTGAVLNVDVSGNASQIMGQLSNAGGNLYVANANGIIVGATAQISAPTFEVGLIGNTLGTTTGFTGLIGSVGYNGTGGNVTVTTGATVSGATVLVSGGGTVNVDLSTLTGTTGTTLSAGLPNSGGAFAASNTSASLVLSGTQVTTPTVTSAGNVSSSGTMALDGNSTVAGTLTNTGALTLQSGFDIAGALVNSKTVTDNGAATVGSLTNNGAFDGGNFALTITAGGLTNNGQITNLTGTIAVTGGDLTNNGQISTGGTTVTGGNLVNAGAITGTGNVTVDDGNLTNNGSMAVGTSVNVTNGSLVNSGTISGATNYIVASDASDAAFTTGGDYSITNTGTISSTTVGGLDFEVNDQFQQTSSSGAGNTLNGSTGSFNSTGTLQVGQVMPLNLTANNDISLGGTVQAYNGTKYAALSASNPLGYVALQAGNYNYNSAFTSTGTLTVTTALTSSSYFSLYGNQVSLMGNLSSIDSSGNPVDEIDIGAGATQASGYAVRVGSGVTLTGTDIYVNGDTASDAPNVLINGTLAANDIELGDNNTVGDVFTGPSGSLSMADTPYLYINSNGRVKTVPYNNDANNFRFNGLSVDVTDGSALSLEIDPSNAQGTPLSAVNLLVNSSVNLTSDGVSQLTGTSAVTGVINVPNTHLVLQSSGSIATVGGFYWPGYVYLGNVMADATTGAAMPGTLGLGTITLGGDFSNVLPGDIAGASGIHFITQFPMVMGNNTVTTNANAYVNFGTDLLTTAYAGGTLGNGQFFGGAQGSGSVVNYGGALSASDFVTQAPSATP